MIKKCLANVKRLSSLAARSKLLRFQNNSTVLANAERSLLRMILIDRLLFPIIVKFSLHKRCLNSPPTFPSSNLNVGLVKVCI